MASKKVLLNESSALLLQRSIESGITSPRELANLMGNAAVETANFSTMHESFNYRSTERIVATVASATHRFSRAQIDQAVESRDPQRIATILYENRQDLGNDQPGDGWRFHGRGYFQYTGRDNYEHWGRQFGVDLLEHPDQAAEPEMAAQLAISYWRAKVPIESREDVSIAAKRINGGENGMAARVNAAEQWLHIITPQLVTKVRNGESICATSRPEAEALTVTQPEPRERSTPLERNRSADFAATYDARALQVDLIGLGYVGRSEHLLTIDGNIGTNTTHAIKSFQHAHHLHVDGIVGPRTLAALEDAKRYPLLSESTNPHHHLYGQIVQGIHKLPHEVQPRERELENAAVALTLSAVSSGLKRVDHVVLGRDGVNLFAVQGRLDDPSHRRAYVEFAHAAKQEPGHRAAMPQQAMSDHVQVVANPNVAQRAQAVAGP